MKRMHTGIAIVVLTAMIAAMLGIGITANAAVVESEADMLFYETLNEIFDYENADTTTVSAEKERVYDIELNELGIAYSFIYGEEQGFALLIDDGALRVTEFYPQGESPYRQEEGKNVYVRQGIYWYSDGGSFYDCETNLPVSENSVELLGEDAYRGTGDAYYENKRVDYIYRSENKYNMLPSIPGCMHGEAASCVAKMCVNLVVYLDKTYPNLIPNYEPGVSFMGSYMYLSDTPETRAVFDQLYIDTGTDGNGATVSDFKSGFKKYANRQGYQASYTSLMSWRTFNYNSAKTAVTSGKPIALFMENYRGLKISELDGYDFLEYEITNGNHAAAGFGCLEVNYTLAGNKTRTDKYVYGALGVALYDKGYINIGEVKIVDAYALTIS